MKTDTETPIRIKGRLVYVGVKHSTKNKAIHCYNEIDENENLSGERNLYDSKLSRGAIGCIIDVEFSEDKKQVFFTKNMIPSSFLKDKDLVSKWRAESEAIETTLRDNKNKISTSNSNPIKDRLEPIRLAYKSSNPQDRISMLANIIEYITR